MPIGGARKSAGARGARAALTLLGGWRFVGDVPKPRRAVCLGYPHTDNMDGVLLVLLTASVGLSVSWMVKDDWCKPPLGPVIRALGGIPIDRSRAHGMVAKMIEEIGRREELRLLIPPEGTRRRADYWKSGFYRIALGAKVPVVPGYLDYATKTGGFGESVELSGDVRADMDRIRAFYAGVNPKAKHPDRVGPIRLREEDAA